MCLPFCGSSTVTQFQMFGPKAQKRAAAAAAYPRVQLTSLVILVPQILISAARLREIERD